MTPLQIAYTRSQELNNAPVHEMVYIPRGHVLLGSTDKQLNRVMAEFSTVHPRSWFEDELPQRRVAVGAFYIDRFPVTNAQFRVFVQNTGYRTLAEQRGSSLVYKNSRWEFTKRASWRDPTGEGQGIEDRLTHPVVQMSWFDARAYAEWARMHLPQEAEWERAAKGDSSRMWPWGDEWNGVRYENCVEYWAKREIKTIEEWRAWWAERCRSDGGRPCTTPVGSFPAGKSPFGVYDMSGNVCEITGSLYRLYSEDRRYFEDYEAIARAQNSYCLRGGSWSMFRWTTRAAERMAIDPRYANTWTGFRCAKDAPDALT